MTEYESAVASGTSAGGNSVIPLLFVRTDVTNMFFANFFRTPVAGEQLLVYFQYLLIRYQLNVEMTYHWKYAVPVNDV